MLITYYYTEHYKLITDSNVLSNSFQYLMIWMIFTKVFLHLFLLRSDIDFNAVLYSEMFRSEVTQIFYQQEL